ncbi:flavin monoamine oxidase family protein [Polaribacter sp. R77954]|uniref:flavin monoamine oxidase family protein n=1 Tax=Polaribacter sp. R77954 TaxID=3093870 RepID=UPI0037CBE884
MNKKIIILGAGISGLYLGHVLKKEGFNIQIIEANNRIGGRIFTKTIKNTKVELGATWLWKYNSELLKLCKALNISIFEQNMHGDALFEANTLTPTQRFKINDNQEVSYRIVGGTKTLLDKLHDNLSADEIITNQKVVTVIGNSTSIKVITKNTTFSADVVISTIPPQLLVNSIDFSPPLNSNVIRIAKNTHTWMKDSIKFAVVYQRPFWKEHGLSGVGFSNVGPFTEIYDHTDFDNKHFALMGFLNGALSHQSKIIRIKKIQEQLFKFFGDDGKNYLFYEEKVWSKETFLNVGNDNFTSPHYNNGHSIYQQHYLNERFIIAGSETSPHYGGYMEGAIIRGNEVLQQLKK